MIQHPLPFMLPHQEVQIGIGPVVTRAHRAREPLWRRHEDRATLSNNTCVNSLQQSGNPEVLARGRAGCPFLWRTHARLCVWSAAARICC
jgi:hypothetical protein